LSCAKCDVHCMRGFAAPHSPSTKSFKAIAHWSIEKCKTFLVVHCSSHLIAYCKWTLFGLLKTKCLVHSSTKKRLNFWRKGDKLTDKQADKAITRSRQWIPQSDIMLSVSRAKVLLYVRINARCVLTIRWQKMKQHLPSYSLSWKMEN